MGSVHEAVDERTGSRVAVKILNAEVVKDGSSRDDSAKLTRFQREARASAAIESEHIVRMLDWGTDDATAQPFMVMELLQGEDLQQLLKRAPILPPSVVLKIAAQACAGLVKAHEARVMHRDIKPANLFLSRAAGGEVVVKLLDFGIAKIRPDGTEELSGETTNLTRTGSMLGSPRYMSPEQARGSKTLDHRTDLWSLGVVMYRSLTGHMPHEDAEAMGDFIVLLCSEPPRSIHAYAPWVPPEIVSLVEGALQIDREKRYADAQEMLHTIRALLPAGERIVEKELVALPEGARGAAPPLTSESRSGVSSADATVPLPTAARRHSMASPPAVVPARREDAGTPAALANTQGDTRDSDARRPRRSAAPFVIGAAVLVLGIGGLAVLRGGELVSGGAAGDDAGAAPTASSALVPAARRATLVILPDDAKVEVDGVAVAAHDGVVELAGVLGSTRRVRVSRDGQEKTVEVVLGESGAEPPKVELELPVPPAATTASPGTTSTAPVAGPRPTGKKPGPAPSGTGAPKNPLIPEKFE